MRSRRNHTAGVCPSSVRVRVRFAKTGKVRFISAIDLGRVWERALRKADLPIAYSEGFHPHPKVSFGDALPLGLASTAEFAELVFAGPIPLSDMTVALNGAFPDGIDVLDAVEVGEGQRRLGKLLQASLWSLRYRDADGLDCAAARLAGDAPLMVQRRRKQQVETIDIRPALAAVAVAGDELRAITHHPGFVPPDRLAADDANGPSVRPDDIHSASGHPAAPVLITRIAQGRAALGGDPTDPVGIDDALRGTRTPLLDAESAAARAVLALPSSPVGGAQEQRHA